MRSLRQLSESPRSICYEILLIENDKKNVSTLLSISVAHLMSTKLFLEIALNRCLISISFMSRTNINVHSEWETSRLLTHCLPLSGLALNWDALHCNRLSQFMVLMHQLFLKTRTPSSNVLTHAWKISPKRPPKLLTMAPLHQIWHVHIRSS